MSMADDRIADILGDVGVGWHFVLYHHTYPGGAFMHESRDVFPGAYQIMVESRIV